MSSIVPLLERAISGRRLSAEDGHRLISSNELAALAAAADAVTSIKLGDPFRTYHVDRNINYTNICSSGCRFCAFSRPKGHAEGFVITREELFAKIEETIALGGDQILLQGGMHPDLPLRWYEDLLADIRKHYPSINIHGFSPPEIHHISRLAGLPEEDVLARLKEAGLGSLPGGGAEILVDRVRERISPCKVSAEGWLAICRAWHRLGGRGSATMMFGHVETPEERIEHLVRLRAVQDETGGFTAFIPWTFQPPNTVLADREPLGAWEYLKTLAVSRLMLDNFDNLQASWVTQGLAVAQLALRFGANDLGSVMIEENVVAATGTRFFATEAQLRETIRLAGFTPRRRDVFYRFVDFEREPPGLEAIS